MGKAIKQDQGEKGVDSGAKTCAFFFLLQNSLIFNIMRYNEINEFQ